MYTVCSLVVAKVKEKEKRVLLTACELCLCCVSKISKFFSEGQEARPTFFFKVPLVVICVQGRI